MKNKSIGFLTIICVFFTSCSVVPVQNQKNKGPDKPVGFVLEPVRCERTKEVAKYVVSRLILSQFGSIQGE
jgi:hypothetical protein